MYDLHLTDSYVPAQADTVVLETTVGGLLRDVAGRNANAPAMVEVNAAGETARRWSYGDLLARAEAQAVALSTRYRPGERVTVWSPNNPEWLVMEYACALAGLVLVTANPAYQAQELRYVLEQSGSAALFLVKAYRGNPMAEIGAQAVAGLSAVREVVDMEDADAMLAHGERVPELPDVKAGDAAQIQYTSGTTGFPKGAVLHHRGLTNNARFYADRAQAGEGATWAHYMPMFHTSGCAMNVLGALQSTSRLLLFNLFDPAVVLDLVTKESVNKLLGVPTMYVAQLEVLQHTAFDTSSVKVGVSGGSMVAPDLVRKVREQIGCEFQTVYGQTETSPLITQHHTGEALDDICNSTGQVVPQTEVSIQNVDTRATQPLGTVGEICVRGYGIMIGYNNNEQATAETIDEDGWLHTGDLGTLDERGYLQITGRVKEMIIRGGENLFPAEIENVLLEHPDVSEIAVVGLPDEKWGEVVACFIKPEAGQTVRPDDLRTYARQHMSPQKTPVVWCQVESFPLTGSGKIQKFALRDQFLAGERRAL